MQTLPFEGHKAACQCKGLGQSNIVCEYEVKGYNWKTKLTQIVKEQFWISRSSEGQDHDATCWWKVLDQSNSVCEYEVNWLTKEKVIRGKRNF